MSSNLGLSNAELFKTADYFRAMGAAFGKGFMDEMELAAKKALLARGRTRPRPARVGSLRRKVPYIDTLMVFVDGQMMRPGHDYKASPDGVIEFAEVLPKGANVQANLRSTNGQTFFVSAKPLNPRGYRV